MESATVARLRRASGTLGIFLTALCTGSVAAILLLILGYVIREGGGALSIDFVTQLPHPVGISGGGVANGIVGSGIIVGIATLISVPIGALTAMYLTFFGRGAFAATVRFLSDVLSGIPSIAIGLFASTL